MTAIAMGSGTAKTLVREVDKRERELADIASRISETEDRVLPVLVPSVARLKDFVTGDIALFTGDFDSDRRLLEHALSTILVYPNGSLVVELRDASLFTPVRQVELGPKALVTVAAPLGRARAVLRDHFADIKKLVASEDPRGADGPYELLVPGDGLPATFFPLTADEPRPSDTAATDRARKRSARATARGTSAGGKVAEASLRGRI